MSGDVFQTASRRAKAHDLSLKDLISAATELAAAGQVCEARELYGIWIAAYDEDPQLYIALFNASTLCTQDGDHANAEALLRKTIALKPDFLPAHINLGGTLERSGAITAAIAQW